MVYNVRMAPNHVKSMQSVVRIGAAAGVTIVGGTLVVGAGQVNAATFTVTNLDDSGPGSLRDALTLANANPDVDQIDFEAGLTGTIVLSGGQLTISTPLSIVGPGADVITVSGNDVSRVLYRTSDYGVSVVTVSGLTLADGAADRGAGLLAFGATALSEVVITANDATERGGGIFFDSPGLNSMITIASSVISDNSAVYDGGGMYMEDTNNSAVAATFISGSVFSRNTAGDNGGGLAMYDPDQPLVIVDSEFSGNTAARNGGGIYLYHIDGGHALTIERSTVSGNAAGGDGGGVSVYDAPAVFRNTTISGNTATGNGGGVATYSVPPTIEHSTVAGNTAGGAGGGVFVLSSTATLSHAIIAGNTAPVDADFSGDLDASFSLIQVAPTGAFTDSGGNIIGSDPLLGPLQDNGGPTLTRLPATGSPAINSGDPAIVAPPATDQRGFARIVSVIDMGAVEVDGGVVSISPLATSVPETAGTVAITVTRSGAGDGTASVDVGTVDGTATAGGDYTAVTQTVSWAAGELGPKVVNVPILTDADLEADETFLVVLSNAIGVTVVDATSVVTITDVVPTTTTTTTTTIPATTTTTVPAPTTTLFVSPPTLAPTLPATGSTDNGLIALVAGAMVALGGVISGFARRRIR